ncbi:lysine-specific demethylase 5A-like [Antedon mediterranea]|uniref:lysine-specific demethylase 5A-like n=1 Tax=Antedon mediterranea TaxID=105859 RepID=UPI003AF89B6C
MIEAEEDFSPPPEAPVFEPTEEEFSDPLGYIAKIRPIALKTGICKIRPPSNWQPPFAVDVDAFKFSPRIQRLNELEAKTRVKLNYLDAIAKFWELQGVRLRIPNVGGKTVDLYNLHKVVEEEGGFDLCRKERKWNKVASRLGYVVGKNFGSQLMKHYEKMLWPHDVFIAGGSMPSTPQPESIEEETNIKDSKEYVSHGMSSRAPMKSNGYMRRYKRAAPEGFENPSEIEIAANPELKKLKLYGAGPKFEGLGLILKDGKEEVKPEPKLERVKREAKSPRKDNQHSSNTRSKTGTFSSSFIETLVCHICSQGDKEDCLLLCEGCDDSFHTFCLVPPLAEVPKGDWRCPKCVLKEVKKPLNPFGFEQASRLYTLQSFGEMADQFKSDYFNMPVHMVPPEMVEKEFWRLVTSIDEDVTVMYGADIHSLDHGSGFPTKENEAIVQDDEDYITAGWNLNNLPVLDASVLCHISSDISGMKIPWMYVGMCFSSFCWHTEDHWSYSINYLHWGEPKTWYGVPGSYAEDFETVMKSNAPELFEAQPDLLHQLVTIISPTVLRKNNVPVFRTNQCAGEFIVTFPRSYHSGFNQGYNFAEAVNFCPNDWLPMGRLCVENYRNLHRFCVFSHEELVCKMAADPESLDLNMAAAVHKEMLLMVEQEKKLRKKLLERGTIEAEREAFELLPDDERQCEHCKTTCFLSAVTCYCSDNKLVCIHHVDKLCSCHPSKHCLRYRYTLDELPGMLHRLKMRAESFDNWANKVKSSLNATKDCKLEISDLREMISEADEKKFPDNDLLQQLVTAIADAEKCRAVAHQLVSKKHRTRNRNSGECKYNSRLTLEELQCFTDQVNNLPCEIKEAEIIQNLLDKVETFQAEAQDALADDSPDSEKLKRLLEIGVELDVELPEMPKLKQELQQARWLDDVRSSLSVPDNITLDTLRMLIDSGVSLAPHQAIEKAMAELQELLTVSERWEEKANICLQAKPRHTVATVEAIIIEAKHIPAYLPNVLNLKDAMKKAKEWSRKVEEIQNGEHFPYVDVLESMVLKGRPIPVRLEQMPQVESQVSSARAWKERTSRTFLKKNSSYGLLEVLMPRTDIGNLQSNKSRKKKLKEMEKQRETERDSIVEGKSEESRDPAVFVAQYKEEEAKELDAMRNLRDKNLRKQQLEEENKEQGKYCICRKGVAGFMLQCELCKDWFHSTCVPMPKNNANKAKVVTAGNANVLSARDMKFLCPLCHRSRRPRLEMILSLLVSLQKLPVRMPDGEALQCLTERAMSWQDRARQALATDELAAALAKLSVHKQKMDEQAAKEKTDRIISEEIQKASNNQELQEHSQNINPNAFNRENASDIHKTSILHGMPPVPTKLDVTDNDSKDGEVLTTLNDSSSDDPSHSTVVQESEHTYSAASKSTPQLVPPKKHPRKSPHVQRPTDTPFLELSEMTRARLEELKMEGELLEVSLDETQHIWRILQASQQTREERIIEHFVEQIPEDFFDKQPRIKQELMKDKKKFKKRKKDGEEVSDDDHENIKPEKKKKKKNKDKDKEKKKEEIKDGINKEIKDGKEKKKKIKKKNKDKDGTKIKNRTDKDKDQVIVVDGDDDDEDEICSAKYCIRPLGDDINWIQCDKCEQWYHLLCIGMKEEPPDDEEYACVKCVRKQNKSFRKSISVSSSTSPRAPSPVTSVKLEKDPSDNDDEEDDHLHIDTGVIGTALEVDEFVSVVSTPAENSPVSQLVAEEQVEVTMEVDGADTSSSSDSDDDMNNSSNDIPKEVNNEQNIQIDNGGELITKSIQEIEIDYSQTESELTEKPVQVEIATSSTATDYPSKYGDKEHDNHSKAVEERVTGSDPVVELATSNSLSEIVDLQTEIKNNVSNNLVQEESTEREEQMLPEDVVGSCIPEENTTVAITSTEVESTDKELECTSAEVESTDKELECTSAEVESTDKELECTSAEVESTCKETDRTNYEIMEVASTDKEVESTNNEIKCTIKEVVSSEKEMECTSTEVQSTDKELESMEVENTYQEMECINNDLKITILQSSSETITSSEIVNELG